MGEKLTNGAEILLRQIHPDLMQDGVPASSSFRPKESDEDMLSVDRGALTTAADSHALYTGNGYASAAVYGVRVSEFEANGVPCESDPLAEADGKKANPAHALASFVGYGTSKRKTLGQKIKKLAVARGMLHPTKASESNEAEA